MFKFVALYKQPADPASFDDWYFNRHTKIAATIPHVDRIENTKITGTPAGASDIYLMVELYFKTQADMDAALTSKEMGDAVANVNENAPDLLMGYFGRVAEPALV